jgi:hypothetical protein
VLFRGLAHMVEIKIPAGELSDPQQSVMSACWRVVGVSAWCAMPRRCLGCIPRARRLVLRGNAPHRVLPPDVANADGRNGLAARSA